MPSILAPARTVSLSRSRERWAARWHGTER